MTGALDGGPPKWVRVPSPASGTTGRLPAGRMFDTMITPEETASDHAAIWAEIKV